MRLGIDLTNTAWVSHFTFKFLVDFYTMWTVDCAYTWPLLH